MTDDHAESAINFIRDTAKIAAEAKARAGYLTEYRKSKKALLMKKHEGLGIKTTAAQEREAYADPDYTEFLTVLETAVIESEKYRFLMKAAELRFEQWRTSQANSRAERQRYGA